MKTATAGGSQLKQMQLGAEELLKIESAPTFVQGNEDEDDGFEDTDVIDDTDEFQSRKMSIRNFNCHMMANVN